MPIDPRTRPAQQRDPSYMAPTVSPSMVAGWQQAAVHGNLAANYGVGAINRLPKRPATHQPPLAPHLVAPGQPGQVLLRNGAMAHVTPMPMQRICPDGYVEYGTRCNRLPAVVPSAHSIVLAHKTHDTSGQPALAFYAFDPHQHNAPSAQTPVTQHARVWDGGKWAHTMIDQQMLSTMVVVLGNVPRGKTLEVRPPRDAHHMNALEMVPMPAHVAHRPVVRTGMSGAEADEAPGMVAGPGQNPVVFSCMPTKIVAKIPLNVRLTNHSVVQRHAGQTLDASAWHYGSQSGGPHYTVALSVSPIGQGAPDSTFHDLTYDMTNMVDVQCAPAAPPPPVERIFHCTPTKIVAKVKLWANGKTVAAGQQIPDSSGQEIFSGTQSYRVYLPKIEFGYAGAVNPITILAGVMTTSALYDQAVQVMCPGDRPSMPMPKKGTPPLMKKMHTQAARGSVAGPQYTPAPHKTGGIKPILNAKRQKPIMPLGAGMARFYKPAIRPASVVGAAAEYYITNKGDTLNRIAAAHHTTAQRIARLNPGVLIAPNKSMSGGFRLRMG